MAYSESQPTVSLIAETTCARGDLYKFVRMSTTTGRVLVVESTAPNQVVGLLLSQTHTTSTGANETVEVGLLSGIGKVYMAASTVHQGIQIGCSTNGEGVKASATTDTQQLGIVVDGSSGGAGRIHSVLFQPPVTPPSTSAGF